QPRPADRPARAESGAERRRPAPKTLRIDRAGVKCAARRRPASRARKSRLADGVLPSKGIRANRLWVQNQVSHERIRTVADHTVKAYDRELDALGRTIIEMGGVVRQMLVDSLDSLTDADVGLAQEVVT